MQIAIFEYQYNRKNGDSFSQYAYELEDIYKIIINDNCTLTTAEKASSERWLIGHDLLFEEGTELPATADELVTKLFNGDIGAQGFDICLGFLDEYSSTLAEIEA